MSFSVRLDEKTRQSLKDAAAVLDRSQSWIVRQAVQAYLDEVKDLNIALDRLHDPDAEWIAHEDAGRELGIKD